MVTKKKFKHADVDISENSKKITLNKIVVEKDKRGQGIGSKIMNEIHKYADKKSKPVTLNPSTDFGGTKKGLEKFYKSHGYEFNKGKNKDYEISESMYRKVKK